MKFSMAQLRRQKPSLHLGKEVHEVHPVKFGGSPTSSLNKLRLTPSDHRGYTTFWNRLQRSIEKK